MLKNKNIHQKLEFELNELTTAVLVFLMSVVTTIGMIDLPSNSKLSRLSMSQKPAYAFVGSEFRSNNLLRNREDTEQNYISYSVSQRTPGRSAKY
jgi:hypothetical protein